MRYLSGLALLALSLGTALPAAASPGLNRCERLVAVGLRQCVAKSERCDACTAAGAPCGDCPTVLHPESHPSCTFLIPPNTPPPDAAADAPLDAPDAAD